MSAVLSESTGDIERALVEIWKETFHLPHLSRHANFFELSGNSVIGLELVEKVAARFNVELPIVMVFQNPTPREMAGYLRSLTSETGLSAADYDDKKRLREQQSAGEDIELLLALPSADTALLHRNLEKSRAQFRQDLFVLSECDFKREGFFVEFGATNGKDLSNTFLLEDEFGWRGILAEPARCWHEQLLANRSAAIETRCIWSKSGARLSFNEAEIGELSTLSAFSGEDYHARTRETGRWYEVETLSLNDLLEKHAAPRQMDYLSIDTEGSEFEILNAFDFEKYQFRCITCEHNFMPVREDVHALLTRHGYVRKYKEFSKVDDWYVKAN